MAKKEIRQFISDLAVHAKISASTQTVTLSAILFLYRDVLKQSLPYIDQIERAKPSKKLPVVFTRSEVQTLLGRLDPNEGKVHTLKAFAISAQGCALATWNTDSKRRKHATPFRVASSINRPAWSQGCHSATLG